MFYHSPEKKKDFIRQEKSDCTLQKEKKMHVITRYNSKYYFNYPGKKI